MTDLKSAPVPLWQQLNATAWVVQSVRAGQSTTRVLPDVDARLRPGVQSQVFAVLRHLGRAEAIRQQLARKAPPPAGDALLCSALALACMPDGPYEAYVLVDQAVEAAKRNPATRAQANFINACLRRYLREAGELLAHTDNNPVAQWNHPQWWIEALRRDHPTQWEAILTANNRHPPMSLRVNLRKTGFWQYMDELLAMNIGIHALPNRREVSDRQGFSLTKPLPIPALPGFAQGAVSVQDLAAQLAAPLLLNGLLPLADGSPLRILDACAAPGGKTAHLLELSDAEVTALDIDHENLQRLGLHAQVVVADAAKPADWWEGRQFDAILLDAPCTASGIVRRHPDVRWLRRASDVPQLAAIQATLLYRLWPLVKPGGRLLYCTCSVFKAEGQTQIEAFLARNTDAQLRPSPGHLLPGAATPLSGVADNQHGDVDGFFYALLEKSAL
jgi:16S rRNA (cytosine967-C5)-methyltransferase